MRKETPIDAFADYGSKATIIEPSEGLEKVASLNTHIPESLQDVIWDLEKNAQEGMTYLYDRALGAGEIYGPNNNGDWFGRNELINRHDTFVKCAHLFRHHQNKDPRNAIGGVVASDYNHELDTVDLILAAPTSNIEKDLSKLASGHVIATSMGAKVKHDVCSICGNQARTRMQYCTHLRNNMLKIFPDGRQVFALNPNPRFIDISIVVIPADPASAVLRKVASLNKISDMKKKDVGNIEERGVLNPTVVDATNNLDRATALHTITEAKGILRPDEFKAIMEKDASIIDSSIIPYVIYEHTPKMAMTSRPLTKLANAISMVEDVALSQSARYVEASFLTPMQKDAYLKYRTTLPKFSRAFLR